MVEFDFAQRINDLRIDQTYYNTLDLESFSQMMKDPSFCYKFYWLEAIVKLIASGVTDTTFNELIDEMIANAWYSVREFHIHLSGIQNGEVRDGLERAVLQLSKLSGLSSNASKVEIKNAIVQYEKELGDAKKQLTNKVPYHALSAFLNKTGETMPWNAPVKMTRSIEKANQTILLPYTLGTSAKLKKEVHFQREWVRMIQDNTVTILGWIQYEKIKWLQFNNPEVPGLVYKLSPLDEKMRKLGHVRNLWEGILENHAVYDIFTGKEINKEKYAVDHFIPWSFVMNDELWNLMPMDSSLNSSKSNYLPKWDPFFKRFAENQYLMYEMVYSTEKIHKLYKLCYRDNLHSLWAGQKLYRKGNSKSEFFEILERNMRPVYDSAEHQGYELWNFK